ncbi:54S ribosomal protein L36, mitochondrial [Phlyctema vagabunda]|uniref:54S ribosomal protein L36, mitochondrial n=1 Tax=Phlyctema vagabunda TaxID=108571 RepID=A0ABR4P8J8_9HELO
MSQLPCSTLRRISLSPSSNPITSLSSASTQQIRNASFLKRPLRPYTFTQLVTLSDGSTYTQRTTSPAPVVKLTKDTRNHPMWQPSLESLRNVEQDEAGRLRAFREKFGRGWDADDVVSVEELEGRVEDNHEDSLMDLIAGKDWNKVKAAPTPVKGKGKGKK